jgi:hypothetical protein
MQQRESAFVPRSPLESLLARNDDAAIDYITDALLGDGDLSAPPPPATREATADAAPEIVEAG